MKGSVKKAIIIIGPDSTCYLCIIELETGGKFSTEI